MWFLGNLWNSVKGTAKQVSLDKVTEITEQIATKGKELVEQAGDKLENVAKDAVATAEHAADKATEATPEQTETTDEAATPAA